MIVAPSGHCSITHAGAGMARRVQVMSWPRFTSRLLVGQGIRTAVDQSVSDQPKTFAEAVFNGYQEVGAALGEVEGKGRLACSASACTSTPPSSTASSSWRSASISPLTSVA